MARRRVKKRTHAGANNPASVRDFKAGMREPKSLVIRIGAGEVGSSVSQLAKDVRRVMEPGTASRLKERRANKLKDYVTMCGPLGVTHLLLFSRSESGNTNLRLALAPRGPTLNFRIEKYSLAKDVQRAQKHPKGVGKEFVTPPLLVMNNFTSESAKTPNHLESLASTTFQSLFPPLNVQTTPLKSIRRVLLLNREQTDEGFILNFRHFAITTKSVGVSKPLRRLHAAESLAAKRSKGLPNLGKLHDISDYMIGGEDGTGYMSDATSGSENDTDAEVEVLGEGTRKIRKKVPAVDDEEPEDNVERRAIKLVELGPRMRLRMTKVEEGLCEGKVMWHEYINKSKEEIKELERKWEARRKEKELRRKQQKENIEKKKKAKAERGEGTEDDDDDDDEMDLDDDYDYDYDYDYEFDRESLQGDTETQVNERMEENDEWEDEEDEIDGDN